MWGFVGKTQYIRANQQPNLQMVRLFRFIGSTGGGGVGAGGQGVVWASPGPNDALALGSGGAVIATVPVG